MKPSQARCPLVAEEITLVKSRSALSGLVRRALVAAIVACTVACGGNGGGTPAADGGALSDGGAVASDGGAQADAGVREVRCMDQSIATLPLFESASTRAITAETAPSGEFNTLIDATAGGLSPTESFVYARFTDTGLVKVDLGDEDALASTQWHVAFRRFLIRLNSGVSGPADLRGARTSTGTTFPGLTAEPANLLYREEQYFTDTCELVTDTSGLGSPATALSSFWSYPGCVDMSGNVYVLSLPNDKRVKLEVTSYYSPDNQTRCHMTGAVNSPSGGGNLRIHWAFIPKR